jgi:hypothetical protein
VGLILKTELNLFVKEEQNWTEDVCRVYIVVTELRTVSVGLCESERQIMNATDAVITASCCFVSYIRRRENTEYTTFGVGRGGGTNI